MRSLVAVASLIFLVAYGHANEISEKYDAQLEAAFAEAAEQGAVFEQSNMTLSQAQRTTFDCTPYHSSTVPTSVHNLMPGDIKVVAAIGDSLTAAQGAKACTVFTVFTNYRGVAFDIGGDDDVDTLPNFIKKYNPNVFGASIKTGNEKSSNSKLNVGVSGAKAENIPDQAGNLVEKLKNEESNGNLNYNEDWKLVTVFIGANDLCAYCKNSGENGKYSSENYKNHVQETLDILKTIPRTFVNLVQILDINPLAQLSGIVCGAVKLFACDCAGKDYNKDAPGLYQEALKQLIDSGRYDTDDDFTVVLQPFLQNYVVPRNSKGQVDKSYFAPDCFHFNQLAHGSVAKGLWNNMIEPEGSKTTDWDVISGTLKCPEPNQWLTTRLNGNGLPPNNGLTAQAMTSNDDNNSRGSSSYSIIVSTSTVAVAVCIMTIVLATVLVAWRVRRGDKKVAEELPLVKSRV